MPTRFCTFLIASLFVMVSPAVYSQQPPNDLGTLVETIDVRVINIDVVVTDKKGNPVPNLKMEDFQLYENGVPQKLTNFYEVATKTGSATAATVGQAAPVAKPEEEQPIHLQRKIVFFLDNLSMSPFNRNRVFKAMKQFASETMRPGDEAMVAAFNRSLKIRLPFTRDAGQVQATLDQIAGESASGTQRVSDRRTTESQIKDARGYEEAVAIARQYSQSVNHDLRETVSSLNALMQMLAGVDGKKIMVLTSEGFPIQPGREMFLYLDEVSRGKQEWQGKTSSFLQGMEFESSSTISAVGQAANANGITLYTIHAGGTAGTSEVSAESFSPVSFGVQSAALTNSTDSLRLMADLTGGIAVVGTNNFKSGFNRIQQDLASYYSLGYRSGTERIDRQRQVDVRVKNRSYQVRSRRAFVEKSVQTEMKDRVVANLFYASGTNDMKVFITTGRPTVAGSDTFKVPVEVHIPMDSLTFIPQGEVHRGGFTVFVVVANKIGDMSDIRDQTHQLTLQPGELEKTKGKLYTYTLDLIVEKGRNKISVGVLDEVGKTTGFERQEVIAADLN